ncbi:glutaredoxin domain-containing protein [Magnetovibrio sp.]|uniref:glutaredoxin domain-containing protein n=1 Tax=Magnetovibrio sp. TaxID=2024836 RepID=UPI002F93906C
MKFVRWLLGRLVLTIDFLTRPQPIKRDPAAQAAIDAKTAPMALYQFEACPFCVKVRRVMRKHALNIELRDAKNNAQFKEELTSQGGKHKVPCLRIENASGEVTWLYESNDIISYLETELQLAS